MKKRSRCSALFCVPALAIAALFSVPAIAAEANSAQAPREAVPAVSAGEYAVLISEETAAREDWRAAAEKFVAHYAGTLVVWRGNDVFSAREELQKLRPRYVAVFAAPEEIDRKFVADLHRLSRQIVPDIYGDFLWGIISGANAEIAAAQLAPAEPLVPERAIGTTNFEGSRFKHAFFITDWKADQFVETLNYKIGEKTDVPAGTQTVDLFAQKWAEIAPQFVITSSHATEFNVEMPFSKGLIASAGTDFYVVPAARMKEFMQRLGNVPETQKFLRDGGFETLTRDGTPKIWIAAGNCLFGDSLRSPFSMAQTAISAAGVRQLVGYTIPTWFGEMGWGTNAKFFNNHQAASVGQAWFFTNQILLNALPPVLAEIDFPLEADGFEGVSASGLTQVLDAHKDDPEVFKRENLGRLYDRDTTAFYGDPLFRVRFDANAPSQPLWNCTLTETAAGTQVFSVKSANGRAAKGDFCLWFPHRFDTQKKFSAKRVFPRRNPTEISVRKARAEAPKPTILTENFVVFRNLELSEGETLELRVPAQKSVPAAP